MINKFITLYNSQYRLFLEADRLLINVVGYLSKKELSKEFLFKQVQIVYNSKFYFQVDFFFVFFLFEHVVV